MTDANPTFDEWLKQGYDLGFCGPPICPEHDGIPMSNAEETILATEGDYCAFVVRLYQDATEKHGVELNHPPSTWRATNLGWYRLR